MNTDRWVNRFQDRRNHRVMFLAHCLLNENTRYLGGACHPAMVREAVEFADDFAMGTGRLEDMHNLSFTAGLETRFGGGNRKNYWPWKPDRDWR